MTNGQNQPNDDTVRTIYDAVRAAPELQIEGGSRLDTKMLGRKGWHIP